MVIDYSALITLISSRIVNILKIPYRAKNKLVPIGSFKGILIAYSKEIIRLEIEIVTL